MTVRVIVRFLTLILPLPFLAFCFSHGRIKLCRICPDMLLNWFMGAPFERYKKYGFGTPSGKVELRSSTFGSLGCEPLPVYREMPKVTGLEWKLLWGTFACVSLFPIRSTCAWRMRIMGGGFRSGKKRSRISSAYSNPMPTCFALMDQNFAAPRSAVGLTRRCCAGLRKRKDSHTRPHD